jgi:hypothetical protein
VLKLSPDGGDDRRVHLREATAFATLSWQRSPRYSLQLTAGGIFDGSATASGAMAGDVGGGGAISLGWSWLPIYESEEGRPFLQVSASLGVSTTTAVSDDGARERLTSGDLRLGVLVGKTFFEKLSVYAAGRVFGGPVYWQLAGESVAGEPEGDVERTTEEGKTSSVHFLHFRFTPAQIARFRTPGTQVLAGFRHPAYGHLAVMPEPVRAALAQDFA